MLTVVFSLGRLILSGMFKYSFTLVGREFKKSIIGGDRSCSSKSWMFVGPVAHVASNPIMIVTKNPIAEYQI